MTDKTSKQEVTVDDTPIFAFVVDEIVQGFAPDVDALDIVAGYEAAARRAINFVSRHRAAIREALRAGTYFGNLPNNWEAEAAALLAWNQAIYPKA